MNPFRSQFGDSEDDGDLFDGYDEFVPAHLPEPGEFLDGHDVLADEDHLDFHEKTKELFEERGVYDMTFNYNLARLNLDTRHEHAGYRYAEEADDPSVLRAEFTPTTPFCPQSHTLTMGSFRAWNGLDDRHDYDHVRVRVHEMHHESESINQQLAALEETYLETGSLTENPNQSAGFGSSPMDDSMENDGPSRGSQAPF